MTITRSSTRRMKSTLTWCWWTGNTILDWSMLRMITGRERTVPICRISLRRESRTLKILPVSTKTSLWNSPSTTTPITIRSSFQRIKWKALHSKTSRSIYSILYLLATLTFHLERHLHTGISSWTGDIRSMCLLKMIASHLCWKICHSMEEAAIPLVSEEILQSLTMKVIGCWIMLDMAGYSRILWGQ